MQHVICECGESLLRLICERTSKSSVNSMIFAFTLIGIGTYSFAAFAFVFAFAFAPIEAPQYVYMLFHSHATYQCIRNFSLMGDQAEDNETM